jgi:hypothetical protein
MYTYTCCRCPQCTARIVLEDRAESETQMIHRPPRPRSGREACPYCRAVFVTENYYIVESGTPLLQQAYIQTIRRLNDGPDNTRTTRRPHGFG